MLRAVVTLSGGTPSVQLYASAPPSTEAAAEATETSVPADNTAASDVHEAEAVDEGPSPIAPEAKEFLWGAGAFIVFAVILRYVAFPRLRKGMDARYGAIRKGFEDADALRGGARDEVARYEEALSAVKAEAAGRVEAARAQLESERQARLAEVNAGIAQRRAAAAAEVEAARQAAATQVNAAVGSVAARAVELATGKRPADGAVAEAVDAVSAVGVGR